jgi:caffeoyl-CoA O-methyltransferase
MRNEEAALSLAEVAYVARHARQDDVLRRVQRETAERPDAQMQVSPDLGGLLELLARLTGAQDALEVGTFTGYSAICIARGIGERGRLTCLELDPGFAEIARANLDDAGVADRVEIRVGPAVDALRAMPEEPGFDLVFLDADKLGYPEYYELIVPRLRPNGLLLIDNMLLGGRVLDPDDERGPVIDALNDRIQADERVDAVLAIVSDGLSVVRKR